MQGQEFSEKERKKKLSYVGSVGLGWGQKKHIRNVEEKKGNPNLCPWGKNLETKHRSFFLEMMHLLS